MHGVDNGIRIRTGQTAKLDVDAIAHGGTILVDHCCFRRKVCFLDETIHPLTILRALATKLATMENSCYFSFRTMQRGWKKNEDGIFAESVYRNTFCTTGVRGFRRGHSRVAGRKRGTPAFPTVPAAKSQRSLHQNVQGLCGSQRPFSVRDNALCSDNVIVHNLRRTPQRAIGKGSRRPGYEILPGNPQPLQGHDRRRLRDRFVEVGTTERQAGFGKGEVCDTPAKQRFAGQRPGWIGCRDSIPLCSAGRLSRQWENQPTPRLPPLAAVERKAALQLPISLPVGEMSSKAEWGVRERLRRFQQALAAEAPCLARS